MKKLILFLILITGVYTAQGQILISLLLGDKLNSEGLEFGLEGGLNWSNISGLDAKKSLRTFNLGFYFDIRIKNQWNFYTGVLVKSNLGVDKLSDNDLQFLKTTIYPESGDYSQRINYFLVPALIKYHFKNRMYLEAGPQFGLMYKAWVEFNSDVDGREIRTRESNKDMINRIDAGLMAGFGYKLKQKLGMSLGVKYYYGLTNVYKNESGTKNSSFFVKLTVPIGAGKKEQSKPV